MYSEDAIYRVFVILTTRITMKKAKYFQHMLEFKRPGGTSRGVLHTKETFILEISEDDRKGTGECGLFRGLSPDDVPDYEQKLKWLCDNINAEEFVIEDNLRKYPSIWFGYEQAMRNLKSGTNIYFPGDFTAGKSAIKINGLIWMGDAEFMTEQISDKLSQGFSCLKLKIGVNWNEEKEIIRELRLKFPADQLELRVDANGAFSFEEAENVLAELKDFQIHSIEQPIKAGQIDKMAALCAETPTPIALDEELIGITGYENRKKLLETIQSQFIILKPTLIGGFSGTDEWINLAESLKIGWWITSALESNIGLNAIAQYTAEKNNPMPQGLGTGGLFTNNFESSLELNGDVLKMKT